MFYIRSPAALDKGTKSLLDSTHRKMGVAVATLTASDIAKHIQRPGEPLRTAVDRLRNWTDMGIIKPTGERHPGTGRKKRYSHEAGLKAVFLQVLTDALGSSAVSIAPSLGRLAQEFKNVSKTGTHLVVINREPGRVESVSVMPADELRAHILKSNQAVHIIIDLYQILHRMTFELGKFY